MPFDASIAARDPAIVARSPTARSPTAHRAPRQTVAREALAPGATPDVSPAPAAAALAPAEPDNAAVPFYSARHPRPVAAIAPRLSRGVL